MSSRTRSEKAKAGVTATMGSIWAVAVNTVKQALRMRVAVVFIVLLAVLLPVMGLSVTGDETAKGKCQTFVSYGLSLTSLLLCLLTIAVSVHTLSSDITEKQLYTVITKPIRRFELILGKFIGVVLLGSALLLLFSAVVYLVTVYTPALSGASAEQLKSVKDEFFTARAALSPGEVDVVKDVENAYKRLDESGQLKELFKDLSRKQIMDRLTKQQKLQKRSAAVGHELVWEFNNVKPLEAGASLFVRFKYDVSVTPTDRQVYGGWRIGDIRQLRYGTGIETPIREYKRKDLIRTFHEIEVPADVVADDGYLAVVFLNAPLNDTTVIFPLEEGLEVLYKADTFTANYIRAVLFILLRLIFLAALGLLASSFLSFPVSILLCLVVFFTANFSGFILESFEYLGENVSDVYSFTFAPLMRALPQFDKFNPSKYLVSGGLMSWALLGQALAVMVFLKAFILLVFTLVIFSYREIAKLTV